MADEVDPYQERFLRNEELKLAHKTLVYEGKKRREALDLAIANRSNGDGVLNIVAAAEEYYAFLFPYTPPCPKK